MLRRNRLTPRPSGRLRRRLTQALGFKSAFGSVASQRQRLGRAPRQYRFFVVFPAGLLVALVGAVSAFATCAPVFVRAFISFSAGAVRRNVTISSAACLSHAGLTISHSCSAFGVALSSIKGRASGSA